MRHPFPRLALALALAAGSPSAPVEAGPFDREPELRSIRMPRSTRPGSGTVDRTWRLHVPASARPGSPAVVFLHGLGGNSRHGLKTTGWKEAADRHGFLLATLDGLCKHPSMPAILPLNPRGWNDGSGRGFWAEEEIDDLGFVSRVLDRLVADHGAAPDRLYLTGHSFGASMTFRAGEALGNRIAAIGPVAGVLWNPAPRLPRPVPLTFVVGELDPLTPPDGAEARRFGRQPAKPPTRDGTAAWAAASGCSGSSADSSRSGLLIDSWEGCQGGSQVFHVEILGQGHGYPGGTGGLPEAIVGPTVDTYAAAEELWSFFEAHSLR